MPQSARTSVFLFFSFPFADLPLSHGHPSFSSLRHLASIALPSLHLASPLPHTMPRRIAFFMCVSHCLAHMLPCLCHGVGEDVDGCESAGGGVGGIGGLD